MKKSKLYQLICVLSPQEWNEIKHFIQTRKSITPQVKQLYQYLYQRRRNLNTSALAIDTVRTNHFDDMSRKNLQNMMSKLCKLVEECLILNQVRKDDIEYEFQQFKLYNDRGLFKLANRKAEALIQKWQNCSQIDRVYFEYILKINHHQFFSYNPIKIEKKHLIIELNQALFDQYIGNKRLYNYATKTAISTKRIDKKELLDFDISSNYLNDNYFKIVNHLNEKEDLNSESFDYLYNELNGKRDINKELKVIMFTHCEIYLRKNLGRTLDNTLGLKILELYEYGAKNKLLTYKDSIGTNKFQSIIQAACYLNQFEWAESFLSKYGDIIAKDHIQESKLMTAVQICFGRCQFDEVINIILFNEFKFHPFRVQCRWFLLSTYFITFDNVDFFESQLTNFTQFFYYNKNKMGDANFEGSLNLAKIFRAYITKPNFSLEEEVSKYEHITFKTRLPRFIEERKRYIKENGIEL